MPIKLIPPRKGKSPYWTIRGTYLGRHVDRSTRARKRALAAQVLKAIERDIERGTLSDPKDIKFGQAVIKYVKAGGEKTYLGKLLEHFRDTPLTQIDQDAVDQAALSLYPKGTAATRNRSVYTPISAVARHAGIRLDLKRPRGASGSQQTSWLWPEQAAAIIKEAHKLDPDFAALLVVLLYTGMRLSEALGLTWNNVRLESGEDGFAYIPDTKNGEPRAVFLPPVALAAVAKLEIRKSDKLFRFSKSGHLYSLLRAAAFKASVDLPERSAFHIFRHTYASWLMRYGGLNTRQLVATGAWKDRKSADRYAHVVTTEEAGRAIMLPVVVEN